MRTALALIGCALASAGLTAHHDNRRTIYVRNESALSNAQLLNALPAFQRALDHDFAPAWDKPARLELIGRAPTPRGEWEITLVDYPACFFCYGYHEVRHGIPHVELGVDDWQITFTHELWEMLVNPYTNLSAEIEGKPTANAFETVDPVEADSLAYTRPGRDGRPISISDFVLPVWFIPDSKGPWDFRRKTDRPLQILDDGYQLVYDDGWMTTIEAR